MPTYTLKLFNNQTIIHPSIQTRTTYPFTMHVARMFFETVEHKTFSFPVRIGSILVYDGKYNPPRGSYVVAMLFAESCETIERLPSIPDPLGTLRIEFSGNGTGISVRATRQ
jgi:hypothetical protein